MTVDLALPAHPTLDQIRRLEGEIRKLPERECPITHHWADGVYGREMFIPAGTVLTGKMHRFATLNVLLEGEITVSTPHGMQRLTAPAIFTGTPGDKKVGYAHTDTRWLNVHPTKLKDVAAIESKFIEPEPPVLLENQS